jgi:2-hydroxy-3-oxopropionate reductase
MKPQIAFLGTGIMGAPMCSHLLDAGYDIRAWNRTIEKTQALSDRGVKVCSKPAEAVMGADFVIIMLSSGPVVDAVLFEEDESDRNTASYLDAGACVIVMSSIPVETSREQATRLAARDVRYIDAPVSGGEKGAKDATLTIMAGGLDEDIQNAREVLTTMGRVTHVGPTGSGQLAKLANQTIVGITIDAVSEALLLAEAGGADLTAVHKALTGGFADSTILRQHGERIIRHQFEPGAKAKIQLKDLRTSRELAESLGLDLPVLKLTESLYRDMCANGRSELDHSALYLELASRRKSL